MNNLVEKKTGNPFFLSSIALLCSLIFFSLLNSIRLLYPFSPFLLPCYAQISISPRLSVKFFLAKLRRMWIDAKSRRGILAPA